MKKYVLSLLISICYALIACGQDFSTNLGVGIVYPFERTYISCDICNRIAPNYILVCACDLSKVETNLSPTLRIDFKHIFCDLGFGWGHRFGGQNINDHNFHTYTMSIFWQNKKYYIGSSMFWRSYQSHIGFHKGTLRICFGMKFTKIRD